MATKKISINNPKEKNCNSCSPHVTYVNGCVTPTPCDCSNSSCDDCTSVILIPLNPAILLAPAKFIIADVVETVVSGSCVKTYSAEFSDVVLVNPNAVLTKCDFRICCYNCQSRFAELAVSPAAFPQALACSLGYFTGV